MIDNSANMTEYKPSSVKLKSFASSGVSKKSVQGDKISFKARPKNDKKQYSNPIKSGFEYLDTTKATLAAGLYAAAEAFYWLADINLTKKTGKSVTKSNYGPLKRLGLVSLGIGVLYFALNLPKNLYNKKIEVFQKKKEMDIYSRTSEAEKTLFQRLATESRTADVVKKRELAGNFMQLRMAKTSGGSTPPAFLKKY